jgi:hypothetical protein
MTSVLSSFSQIPTHSKYFIAVNSNATAPSTSTFPSDPTIAAFTVGSASGNVALGPGDVTTDDIIVAISDYTTETITAGTLFRDLGRKVSIYNIIGVNANPLSTSYLMAVYRQMQIVNGPLTEGTPAPYVTGGYPTIYVKVWSADGSELDSVCVARTG